MQVKRVKFKKVSVEDFAEILKMGAEAERKRMLEIVENRRIWHKGEFTFRTTSFMILAYD